MKEFFWNLFLSSFICGTVGLMLLGFISNLRGALYTAPPELGKTILAISLLIALMYTIMQQKRKRKRDEERMRERKRREGEQERALNLLRDLRKRFFYI